MKRKRKQEEKKRKKRHICENGISSRNAVPSKLTLTYISTIHQNYYKPKSQL